MLRMLALIVLFEEVNGVCYLLFYLLDLLVNDVALMWLNILQLREQLPHVHVQHLQLLFQLEHSEGVVVERHSRSGHEH